MIKLQRILTALLFAMLTASASAQYVHTRGKEIVDGQGHPLQLHGINLGNWMVTEGYMWKFEGGPQSTRAVSYTHLTLPTNREV